MPLLIEIGGTPLRVSNEQVELANFWDAFVESCSSLQYRTASNHGGFVEISAGNMKFSPAAFSGNWPPPIQTTIAIKYTDSTEAAAITIISGDLRRMDYDALGVSYKLNPPKYIKNLLDEGVDYNGDTVPYPKAFGPVSYVEPLRVADVGGNPTYWMAGLSGAGSGISIVAFEYASAGAATKVTTSSAHGYGNGETVHIGGSTDYNGSHVISAASGSVFTIPVAFSATNSEALPLTAVAYQAGELSVYDSGVPIPSRVLILTGGDVGKFSLTASPVGQVTMSGTPADTTLLEVMTWGQVRLGIGSIVSTNSRAVSPEVSRYETEQRPLIDFMSDLCKCFTHYFYIQSDVLTLGDMLLDNGSASYAESGYFTGSYGTRNAVSLLRAKWTTRRHAEGWVDGVRTSQYLEDVKNVVTKSLHTVASGTADGTSADHLIDSSNPFTNVLVGHIAKNLTDDTESIITAVASGTMTLEDDIFVSGEEYIVGPSFPYGQEIDVKVYHDTRANVVTILDNIMTVLNRDVGKMSIPISAAAPVPGKKITYVDTDTPSDMSTWIRARAMVYNFELSQYDVQIEGEGVAA